VLFCLWPSHRILKIISNPPKLTHSALQAGTPFWVKIDSQDDSGFAQNQIRYFFDSFRLIPVSKDTFFGAIPIQSSRGSSFVAISQIQKSFFNFPIQDIAFAPAEVSERKLNNPANLRIPASFMEEAQNAHDEISEQKKLISSVLLKNSGGEFCFSSQAPLQSKTVSLFGSYRRLPTGKEYFHTGLDKRAWYGTPIQAMADGTVALTGKFILPGNSVYIDHGNGIYSKYFHLSEINVHDGQKIKKGDFIGKSGATGRVEAPHFHWEVSWNGFSIDPEAFIQLQKSLCP